ncbi:hydroxyethylthiazole kinase [Lutimaribacter sp. EGI FJ00015]|uniref:Hydroxyethylthiazole kinase n=1 Tax=Lutimaribacter degradans TaxID=2945989 RepID=A0ACC5ZZC7_9RHOB|nr:hydroxyethylthiazole kinase [Lutimaribacter sp. EGI FJ00013]MCM2563692.1 hydroxyethylthiazole kinase [Lutimaribacter sp. EGI FJ00013]MCO0614876.1 hydroxyethylthiazole kinase [Lutimaribacter sp. EGI FJ00015]MCO0637544.1 hydroxyethylthiazole kinase [Lutimaribacter sp. EGI FJ00014]
MKECGAYLETMRANAPLVQNITNYVAMNVMANVLLAAGASPAMVHDAGEAGEFARIAQALTVNIGTLSPHWLRGMEAAAQVAHDTGTPWALDPVAVGATAMRRDAGARLLALKPTVIRGNASEILALAGAEAAGKGADAADSVTAAEGAARDLARATGAVVAVTGAQDYATDGEAGYRVDNGHALMPRITVMGCSLTGVVGAFLVGQSPLSATVAALAYYGLAGERAGAQAAGPGSFQPAFLDALYALTPQEVTAGARVTRA